MGAGQQDEDPKQKEEKQDAQWCDLNRKKIQVVVKHQFFVFFAPLGAIFVYQLLIISGTATNQFMVGIAALAAGVTPYWLLNKALRMVKNILKGPSEKESANTPGKGSTHGL